MLKLFSAVILAVAAHADAQEGAAVIRLDPALDAIVGADAKVERVATGFDSPRGRSGSGRADS